MISKARNAVIPSFIESLEPRQLLSGGVPTITTPTPTTTPAPITVQTFSRRPTAATRLQFFAIPATTLMGQPLTLSVKLTAGGLPLRTATIKLTDDKGNPVATLVTARSGYASLTIPNAFIGTYHLKAAFAGASRYLASQSGLVTVTINQPTFVTAGNGLRTATVVNGSGPAATAGQTENVKYTGFLTNGSRFDTNENGDPNSLLAVHNVIPGFQQGVAGMKIGETRVIVIPPALGYGANPPQGSSIPANATLIFIVTLKTLT